MNLYYNRLKKWEIGGVFWITIVGSLLHFIYEWSNKSTIGAVFGPVNESLWEHLKLGYWSLAFYMIIEYWFIRRYTNNFLIAKTTGILAMNLLIVIGVSAYTAISKKHIFILDIGLFILGAILCQYISFKIMEKGTNNILNKAGLVLFILIGFVLVFFTFKPLHYSIFRDPTKGIYGIDDK